LEGGSKTSRAPTFREIARITLPTERDPSRTPRGPRLSRSASFGSLPRQPPASPAAPGHVRRVSDIGLDHRRVDSRRPRAKPPSSPSRSPLASSHQPPPIPPTRQLCTPPTRPATNRTPPAIAALSPTRCAASPPSSARTSPSRSSAANTPARPPATPQRSAAIADVPACAPWTRPAAVRQSGSNRTGAVQRARHLAHQRLVAPASPLLYQHQHPARPPALGNRPQQVRIPERTIETSRKETAPPGQPSIDTAAFGRRCLSGISSTRSSIGGNR